MAIGIGIFISGGLLTVEPRYAEGKEQMCTVKTLKGRYLFALNSTLLPPAFGVTEPTPSSAAGFHVFNGDGTGTDIVTFRLGGVTVLENSAAPISYTVNSDCTGSYTVLSGRPSSSSRPMASPSSPSPRIHQAMGGLASLRECHARSTAQVRSGAGAHRSLIAFRPLPALSSLFVPRALESNQ
jgi:hypothetical protein